MCVPLSDTSAPSPHRGRYSSPRCNASITRQGREGKGPGRRPRPARGHHRTAPAEGILRGGPTAPAQPPAGGGGDILGAGAAPPEAGCRQGRLRSRAATGPDTGEALGIPAGPPPLRRTGRGERRRLPATHTANKSGPRQVRRPPARGGAARPQPPTPYPGPHGAGGGG